MVKEKIVRYDAQARRGGVLECKRATKEKRTYHCLPDVDHDDLFPIGKQNECKCEGLDYSSKADAKDVREDSRSTSELTLMLTLPDSLADDIIQTMTLVFYFEKTSFCHSRFRSKKLSVPAG